MSRDPFEPLGHPTNRVMHDVRKRMDKAREEIEAENAEADNVDAELDTAIERLKQEQNQ